MVSYVFVVPPGSPHGTPPQMVDTIRRHEVEVVLQNQNSMINLARELKNFVVDIHSRVDNVLQNQARQPTAQVQSVG